MSSTKYEESSKILQIDFEQDNISIIDEIFGQNTCKCWDLGKFLSKKCQFFL